MTELIRWTKRWRNSLVYSAAILTASGIIEWVIKR